MSASLHLLSLKSAGEGVIIIMEVKCALCGRVKLENKRFQRHHISYADDITMLLCYTCHSYVHGRSFMKMRNQWELKYGKDKGFIELARKFIKVTDKLLQKV